MPGLSATLPMVIFGSLTVAAGLLSLLLPETLMCNMAQTVEEIEKDKEFYGMVCMGKPRPCPLTCPCCRYLSISFTVLKNCQIQSEAWLRFLRSMKFFSSQEYLQREPVQYSPIRTCGQQMNEGTSCLMRFVEKENRRGLHSHPPPLFPKKISIQESNTS